MTDPNQKQTVPPITSKGNQLLIPGLKFGDYKIVKLLGRSLMGEVYQAQHIEENDFFVIKVLFEETTSGSTKENIDSYIKDLDVIKSVNHTNIVMIRSYSDDQGSLWIVLENFKGVNTKNGPALSMLDYVLSRDGTFPEEKIVEYLIQVLEGLSFLHKKGIVHGNLKPQNILMTPDGVVLSDFGLMKLYGENRLKAEIEEMEEYQKSLLNRHPTLPPIPIESQENSKVNKSKLYREAIRYLSPEQKSGNCATIQSDIYSVALIGYFMLTKRFPSDYKPPSELDIKINAGWDEWFKKALSTDSQGRYNSAAAMIKGIPLLKEVIQKRKKNVGKKSIVRGSTSYAASRLGETPMIDPGGAVLRAQWLENLMAYLTRKGAKIAIPAIVVLAIAVSYFVGKINTNKEHVYPAIEQNWIVPSVGMEMIWIPAGTFVMGSPDTEEGHKSDESPQVEVNLSTGFWMGKFEVTQSQYKKLTRSSPSNFSKAGSNAPVENVNWSDALQYCLKLTHQEREEGRLQKGYRYSLPTEAQWEYACRSGIRLPIYTGDFTVDGIYSSPELSVVAWYGGNSGVDYPGGEDSTNWPEKQIRHESAGTHRVGEKLPNSFGLYDMLGNVAEWCYDWYGSYEGNSVVDYKGPKNGESKVYRGGSWSSTARLCRSATRKNSAPGEKLTNVGFRVVLVPAK